MNKDILLKEPHFHSVYLLGIRIFIFGTVYYNKAMVLQWVVCYELVKNSMQSFQFYLLIQTHIHDENVIAHQNFVFLSLFHFISCPFSTTVPSEISFLAILATARAQMIKSIPAT